jgi:RNA polymerase sigma-70 factor, ECF subfamily
MASVAVHAVKGVKATSSLFWATRKMPRFATGRASIAPANRERCSSARMMPANEAADLVEAIATRRDRAAFAALFRHFAPRIKAFIMRGGADAEAAQEVAQEALIMVWQKAASFDRSRASVATWLYTIARNKRIDLLRRGARPAIEPEDWLTVFAPEDNVPDKSIAIEQANERVKKLLRELPPDQLLVIQKAFFEDKTHSDIALELKQPLGTIKSRIRLGLLRLRDALEKDEE